MVEKRTVFPPLFFGPKLAGRIAVRLRARRARTSKILYLRRGASTLGDIAAERQDQEKDGKVPAYGVGVGQHS
jgi:hypothetical protein